VDQEREKGRSYWEVASENDEPLRVSEESGGCWAVED
jgi:hypothetical protein